MVLFLLFYVLFITILCINNHIEYKNKQKIEKVFVSIKIFIIFDICNE
jgi:hypothetical protein